MGAGIDFIYEDGPLTDDRHTRRLVLGAGMWAGEPFRASLPFVRVVFEG
jgi:hypothetical protein